MLFLVSCGVLCAPRKYTTFLYVRNSRKLTVSILLGVKDGMGVYLLFNGIMKDKSANGGNMLTRPLLAQLPKHNGPKIIYGNGTLLSEHTLQELGITFRQVPYEIKVS